MKNFTGFTADQVWRKAANELLFAPDYTHDGRNGETREILPCTFRVKNPRERWILSRSPPHNPAFGLVEVVWILTGHNESIVPNFWNPQLPKFAGDVTEYYGAYGYRLRKAFGIDQIKRAYEVLKYAPQTRQAILQIWKPDLDLPSEYGKPMSEDIPCNVMSLLKIRNNRLHWSQIMRSNDIMRGLPNNIIQFTMLQEIIAGWLKCELGEYFHMSDSLHVYEKDIERFSVVLPCTTKKGLSPRIVLSFNETNILFSEIYTDLFNVANGKNTREDLLYVFAKDSANNYGRSAFIKDILAVIGSDAARRCRHPELAQDLAASCEDRKLRAAAKAWLTYMELRNE